MDHAQQPDIPINTKTHGSEAADKPANNPESSAAPPPPSSLGMKPTVFQFGGSNTTFQDFSPTIAENPAHAPTEHAADNFEPIFPKLPIAGTGNQKCGWFSEAPNGTPIFSVDLPRSPPHAPQQESEQATGPEERRKRERHDGEFVPAVARSNLPLLPRAPRRALRPQGHIREFPNFVVPTVVPAGHEENKEE